MTEPAGAPAWTILELEADNDVADIVSDGLWGLGVSAVEEIASSGGSVTLRANVSVESADAVADLARRHGATFRWVTVPASVTETWREHARPTHVVDDVWLVPAWVPSPAGRSVIVEPFDVFGLGNHPTTTLALAAALAVARRGDFVLDMGSGSGVLAVALSALVGCRCECHDIAAQSRHAVEHNARLNGVGSLVEWNGDPAAGEPARYDLVVANILAPVLCDLATALQSVTASNGTIVLSGLRDDQAGRVLAAYGTCELVAQDSREGWTALTLRRS